MAGYSGTPLIQKLGIRAGRPEGVDTRRGMRAKPDVLLFFTRRRADLEKKPEGRGRACGSCGEPSAAGSPTRALACSGVGTGSDDGRARQLSPRIVTVWRAVLFLGVAAPLTLAALAGEIAWLVAADPPVPGALTVVVAAASGAFAWSWPAARFRHWTWAMKADVLELRHGVVWSAHSSVPYFRVQHVDISQGPIERRLGLAELVLHTAAAGTDAKLPGVAAEDAGALRAAILDRAGTGDAV